MKIVDKNEYVTKLKIIITVTTAREYNDSNRCQINKQNQRRRAGRRSYGKKRTNLQIDKQTYTWPQIQTGKQKDRMRPYVLLLLK